MKFVIHHTDYMGINPRLFQLEANSLKDVLIEIMGEPSDCEEKEYLETLKEEDVIEMFEEGNGDGQPYFTIMNEDGKVVVGGMDDEDYED